MPEPPESQSWRWLVMEFPADDRPKLKHWLQAADLIEVAGVIPVFRLPAGTRILDDKTYQEAVLREIKRWAQSKPLAALELDYDCPTSRLRDYAAWLKLVRQELQVKQLSVTCLASWILAPDFQRLCNAVDELCPMFYDLEQDDPKKVIQGEPLAMVDGSTLEWIGRWRRCPISWRAGLPNYCRLSLFHSNGKLIGHLRQWDHASLGMHPDLGRQGGEGPDLVIFRAAISCEYSGVAVPEGGLLVQRQPNESMLISAIDEAKRGGASGVIWFAHPHSAPAYAYSEPHLSGLLSGEAPEPELSQRVDPDGSIVLVNEGMGDLPVLPEGKLYHLRVDADAFMRFAHPAPGDFSDMWPAGAVTNPEALKHIDLFYSRLPAGGIIRSAPGTMGSTK